MHHRKSASPLCLALAAISSLVLLVSAAAAQNTFPPSGDVGIGTAQPDGALHIVEPGEPPAGLPAGSNGLLLGIESTGGYKWIQSYGGILTLNPRGNGVAIGREDASHRLDVDGAARLRANGATNVLISGGSDDVFFDLIKNSSTTPSARIEFEGFTDAQRHEGEIAFFTRQPSDSALAERMRIRSDGTVAIGATLRVGSTVDITNPVFNALRLYSRSHACLIELGGSRFQIGSCLSDAEYVPAIDLGEGPLETGELVAVASGELTAELGLPFAVVRSAEACDPALIGLISDPQHGASGKRIDKSSIPLATTGFFPVRVTLEGGPIRAGDAITSSSVPGWGMRSPGGCRIVGYALEDADAEGLVTVRAELADQGTASALVDDLVRRIEKLEERLAAAE